ncbi:phasin family protein [Asticcacaulis sp. W401b]|uniref:phasin family protein n=1 Tax=Asticcacaulis sp. W401b TaxID=3388666 RepID=UPI003970A6D0
MPESAASEAIHAMAKCLDVTAVQTERMGLASISFTASAIGRATEQIKAVSTAQNFSDLIDKQTRLFNDNVGDYMRDVWNMNDVFVKSMSAMYEPMRIGIEASIKATSDTRERDVEPQ